jgi:hypothetical protein
MLNEFHSSMIKWINEGKIKWKETIVGGLESAPNAFIGLFNRENFDKLLVKIYSDKEYRDRLDKAEYLSSDYFQLEKIEEQQEKIKGKLSYLKIA